MRAIVASSNDKKGSATTPNKWILFTRTSWRTSCLQKNQQRGIWWSEVRFSGVYSKCILLNKEQDDFQSSNLLEVDNIPLPAMRSIFDASFTWRRLQVARCAYHFIFVLESIWTHWGKSHGHITKSLKWDPVLIIFRLDWVMCKILLTF